MAKKYPKIKRHKIHYKKSRKNISILKTILFIVLIAALVFLAYSVAGPIKKLFTGELTSSSDAPPSGSQTVSSVPDTSSVSSEPPVTETAVKAITLPQDILLDSARLSSFLEQAKTDGYTAVMAQLKDEEGLIYYQSAAGAENAVVPNAVNAAELAKKIKDAGLTPIASVHTFKDKTAANKSRDNTFMVKDSTYTWFDKSANEGGKPWLNPYKDAARSYNTALIEELAQAGFEEIVLKSVQFPDVYSMSKAVLPASPSFSEMLSQYVSEAEAAAAKYQAKISVSYSSASYWTAQKVPLGGEAGAVTAKRISPVIRFADYGGSLTIGEAVLENPASDPVAALRMILTEIQVKTSAQKPEIIPILSANEVNDVLLATLEQLGISNYIVE